jgi:hypothetical protein
LSFLDPSIVVDPFTFSALIGIAVWLDRRLRRVEAAQAYNRGFEQGQQSEREVKK